MPTQDFLLDILDSLDALAVKNSRLSEEDLAKIVTATVGVASPTVSADEIGRAVADALEFPQPTDFTVLEKVLVELKESLKKLDWRMKGIGPAFGASGPSNIASDASRLLGHVTVDNEVTVVSSPPDQETLLDYDTRTDGNAVYVGNASPGASQSSAVWIILKLTYDSSSRLTRKQTQIDKKWTERTTGW